MNANEFVETIQSACEHFDLCTDGCPFFISGHAGTCCKLKFVTGCAPHKLEADSREKQTNDSNVESTLEQIAEESPSITINAKEVYVSFYK